MTRYQLNLTLSNGSGKHNSVTPIMTHKNNDKMRASDLDANPNFSEGLSSTRHLRYYYDVGGLFHKKVHNGATTIATLLKLKEACNSMDACFTTDMNDEVYVEQYNDLMRQINYLYTVAGSSRQTYAANVVQATLLLEKLTDTLDKLYAKKHDEFQQQGFPKQYHAICSFMPDVYSKLKQFASVRKVRHSSMIMRSLFKDTPFSNNDFQVFQSKYVLLLEQTNNPRQQFISAVEPDVTVGDIRKDKKFEELSRAFKNAQEQSKVLSQNVGRQQSLLKAQKSQEKNHGTMVLLADHLEAHYKQHLLVVRDNKKSCHSDTVEREDIWSKVIQASGLLLEVQEEYPLVLPKKLATGSYGKLFSVLSYGQFSELKELVIMKRNTQILKVITVFQQVNQFHIDELGALITQQSKEDIRIEGLHAKVLHNTLVTMSLNRVLNSLLNDDVDDWFSNSFGQSSELSSMSKVRTLLEDKVLLEDRVVNINEFHALLTNQNSCNRFIEDFFKVGNAHGIALPISSWAVDVKTLQFQDKDSCPTSSAQLADIKTKYLTRVKAIMQRENTDSAFLSKLVRTIFNVLDSSKSEIIDVEYIARNVINDMCISDFTWLYSGNGQMTLHTDSIIDVFDHIVHFLLLSQHNRVGSIFFRKETNSISKLRKLVALH